MALEIGQLERSIIRILTTDPAVNSINFTLKGPGTLSIRISSLDYRTIARLIVTEKSPDTPSIKCVFDPSIRSGGRYEATFDTLRFAVRDFLTLREEALLIHECTHAINDMNKIQRLPLISNEASGYIAQCLYGIKKGFDPVNQASPIFREAGRIAQKIIKGKREVSYQDRQELEGVIIDDSTYNSDANRIDDLNGITDPENNFESESISLFNHRFFYDGIMKELAGPDRHKQLFLYRPNTNMNGDWAPTGLYEERWNP